ncbi:hypothetical protein [Streptomyces sp. NPDC004014]
MRRALGAGLAAGVFLGLFVLVESGAWAAAVVVLLVLTPLHGVRVARRMSAVWPAGADLDPADRAAVVRATRSGGTVSDPRPAPDVLRYAEALRVTAERDRIRRWVMVLVAVASLVLAGYGTVAGTARQALVSLAGGRPGGAGPGLVAEAQGPPDGPGGARRGGGPRAA